MLFDLVIILITIIIILIKTNTIEKYSNNKIDLFNELMNIHYEKIFPNNANRNAAGFRFFRYIYDNLAENEELFDLYNQFYCAVSGAIITPENPNNFSVLKVSDKSGNCVFGKYYRCCVPCNCDIMKYAQVVRTKIAIPKNSYNFFYKNLLTIGDPCEKLSETKKLPTETDKNVFKCANKKLSLGYRVDEKGNLTTGKGRLVIGVLYPVEPNEQPLVEQSLKICTTGTKRLYSDPNNLQYGMGDIFVKIALVNNKNKYKNSEEDLCKL